MPVNFNPLPKLFNEFSSEGGGGTDYLVGPVQGMMEALEDFEIFWATENKPLRFNADKTITRGQLNKWTGIPTVPLNSYDNGSFIKDGWHVNDTMDVTGTASNNGSYTIVAVSDAQLQVAQALITEDALTASLYGTTKITAIDYYFAQIENASPEDYHSLTDRDTIQRYTKSGLDASVPGAYQTMTPAMNSKASVNGSVQIQAVGIVNYRQKFRIRHYFFIYPVYRAGQLTNLENGIPPAPEYFGDRKSLKFICKIDAKFNVLDPNIPHTSILTGFKNGNVGWLDEFVNGNDPEYTLASVNIYNSEAQVVDEIPLNAGDGTALGKPGVVLQGAVILTIRSASAKFGGGMRMVLNHQWLPIDENDYMNQKTKQLMDCFKWDRVMLIHGLGPVNGDNYGTDNQVIYQAQLNVSDASLATITYYIKMSPAMLADLRTRSTNDRHYLVSVINQSKDIMLSNATDSNTTKVLVGSYSYNTDNADLFTVPNGTRYYHWPDEVTNPRTNYDGSCGDRIYTRTQFMVKWGSQLMSLKQTVEAVHPTKGSFPLMSRAWNLAGAPFTNGITQVNIQEIQNYPGNINEPENRVRVKNMPALNNGFYAGYELDFGFRAGYEYWKPLDGAHSDFPNASQDWSEYSEVNGWQVKTRVYATVQDENGVQTDFIHTGDMRVRNCTWVIATNVGRLTAVIQTFSEDGSTDLQGAILTEANTLVKATITGNFAGFDPKNVNYGGFLILGRFLGDGVYEDQIISTQGAAALENDSPWFGDPDIDPNHCSVTADISGFPVGIIQDITISAFIDFTKLQPAEAYVLQCYFGAFPAQRLLLKEDNWPLLKEDGGGILLE